jgi:hypothetical protein
MKEPRAVAMCWIHPHRGRIRNAQYTVSTDLLFSDMLQQWICWWSTELHHMRDACKTWNVCTWFIGSSSSSSAHRHFWWAWVKCADKKTIRKSAWSTLSLWCCWWYGSPEKIHTKRSQPSKSNPKPELYPIARIHLHPLQQIKLILWLFISPISSPGQIFERVCTLAKSNKVTKLRVYNVYSKNFRHDYSGLHKNAPFFSQKKKNLSMMPTAKMSSYQGLSDIGFKKMMSFGVHTATSILDGHKCIFFCNLILLWIDIYRSMEKLPDIHRRVC